jgi:hypothetical protein
MDKIDKLMKVLGVTEEEAWEIHAHDKAVEKGADPYPLTVEQEKASKQARQVSKAPTIYKLDNTAGKRSKKEDTDKATLLNTLFTAILPMCDTYEVTNAEREFCFTYHERKFKVVLSAPRS